MWNRSCQYAERQIDAYANRPAKHSIKAVRFVFVTLIEQPNIGVCKYRAFITIWCEVRTKPYLKPSIVSSENPAKFGECCYKLRFVQIQIHDQIFHVSMQYLHRRITVRYHVM